MKTLDLKKQYKNLYQPSARKIEIVQVPKLQFAMIDGAIEKGSEPGKSPSFADATQALYSISYTLKFMFKKRQTDPVDYPVMALEGLWFVEDGHFDIQVKDNWIYTLMILVPDLVTPETFAEALAQLRKKKGDLPAYSRVRLESFQEGLSVQTMHIGPYAEEPATVARMEAFAHENGFAFSHKHHEIYLGDPRRANPSKMKTVLRHPVEKANSQ